MLSDYHVPGRLHLGKKLVAKVVAGLSFFILFIKPQVPVEMPRLL